MYNSKYFLKFFFLIVVLKFSIANAFEYVGCFQDIHAKRMFTLVNYLDKTNSVYNCGSYCQENLYVYAGLQYGRDCWCSNRLNDTITYPKLFESSCTMSCPGNQAEKCGASGIMSVYKTGNRGKK